MKQVVDFEATIQKFFDEAIMWLKVQPMRRHNGKDEQEMARQYLVMVRKNPAMHLADNYVYGHFEDLSGFLERGVSKNGNSLVENNDLFYAVVRVLDSIGKYYKFHDGHHQAELLKNIKEFKIALNRHDWLKSTFYKMQAPYYFAQKQK